MVYTPKTAKLIEKLHAEYEKATQEEFVDKLGLKDRAVITKLKKAGYSLNVEYLLNALEWFKAGKSEKEYKEFLFRLFK